MNTPLSFNYNDLECEFSLEPIKPAVGAEISIGDTVSVVFRYTLQNVPAGAQITVFPGVISNESDFQNFLPVKGFQLSGDNTLLNDALSPATQSLTGSLNFQYTHQGLETGRFDSIIASLKFERLATKADAVGIPNSAIIPNISHIPIPSKDISCTSDITSNVDWLFLDKR